MICEILRIDDGYAPRTYNLIAIFQHIDKLVNTEIEPVTIGYNSFHGYTYVDFQDHQFQICQNEFNKNLLLIIETEDGDQIELEYFQFKDITSFKELTRLVQNTKELAKADDEEEDEE